MLPQGLQGPWPSRYWVIPVVSLLGCLYGTFASPVGAQSSTDEAARFEVEEFAIVDCLLPGRTTRIGKSRVKGPRRATKTSARDCNIRGGEHVAYDRADCRTSLKFWQVRAETGDSEAAFYVGQLLERGCEGLAPDPSKAVSWYDRALEHGSWPARLALAGLYDRGHGVEKDPGKAMALLRQDLPDEVTLIDTQEFAELESAARRADDRADDLEQQLLKAEQQLEASDTNRETLSRSVTRLEAELGEARDRQASTQQLVEQLERQLLAPPPEKAPRPTSLDFGTYHALVIGNSDYQHLDPIPQAASYAQSVASLLERRYDFRVQRLMNATYEALYRKLETLRGELTEDDNLLIYYVGSSFRESGRSYWHPVDAEDEASRFNWLEVERHLSSVIDVIPARQLLVVADAAFEGVRVRSAVPQLPVGMSARQRKKHMEDMLKRRSRMVMASGKGPSPFSPALVGCLEENRAIAGASRIYGCVLARMRQNTSSASSDTSRYAPIRWGQSDANSDFFFVPTKPSRAGAH